MSQRAIITVYMARRQKMCGYVAIVGEEGVYLCDDTLCHFFFVYCHKKKENYCVSNNNYQSDSKKDG